ncbi:outer membrane beta-barrel protein [Salibacter halophilus]|uniref:PorT family protein n=1 Tax=Salibacter halophilus TaxID=1803916 RepID=A0A6N6M9Z7_9FLAO|nr:outer membrane beta-barrel protein [Salibacter halophilus]KAB1065981.1 PorT family protein [Salibacter halophilus]
MEKVVLAIALLFCSSTIFSQSSDSIDEKRLKYGFNLGLNYSNLLDDDKLPENASVTNNFGFRLGVLADYSVSELFHISPKAELSFNNSKVELDRADGSQLDYEVMPVSLEFMTHFLFKDNKEKLSPYFYVGPNVKLPLLLKEPGKTEFPTRYDFAIDFGVGVDKPLKHFNFAPELRYSFGLHNVNGHPELQTLYFHNISLVFSFLG